MSCYTLLGETDLRVDMIISFQVLLGFIEPHLLEGGVALLLAIVLRLV